MYEKFYKLKENPFQIVPNPDYLYLSSKHENALAYLRYGLVQNAAFTLLTGEIGTGKTTVGLFFLNQFCKDIKTAFVSNTNVLPDQLLELILKKFNLHSNFSDKTKNLELLHLFLTENYMKKIRSLLIIDEAQNLSEASLEEIRMLSNFQKDGQLLLQIMMVGQTELKVRLKRQNLANISQRISASYHLTALSAHETRKYIAYRLEKAGGDSQLISREAKDLIYDKSAGIPRIINLLCDAALLYGFAEGLQPINRQAVENAIKERNNPGIDYSSEYAISILSAPMMEDESKDENKNDSKIESKDESKIESKYESKDERGNDLLKRIEAIEVDLNRLQKQVDETGEEIESSLNFINASLIRKIKKILIYERKRTNQLIKKYFQKLYNHFTPHKTLIENKKQKGNEIKRRLDYDI
jgi:general secretion pathway protein A